MRCVFCHFIHSLSCHCNLLTWCVSWLFLRSNSSRLVLLARPEQNAAKHSCGQNSSSKIEYAVLWYFSEHKQQINHWLFLYLLLCMNIDACLEPGPLGSKNYIYSFTSLETNTSDIGLERWTTRDDEWSDHIDTSQGIHQTWNLSNILPEQDLQNAYIATFLVTNCDWRMFYLSASPTHLLLEVGWLTKPLYTVQFDFGGFQRLQFLSHLQKRIFLE